MTGPASGVIEVTRAGGTATVLLSRPEVLNAINVEMLTALRAALEELSADPGIKAVILAGKGRAFSAGVDLKALGGGQVSNGGAGEALDGLARAVTSLLSTMPKVTIARVHGFCYTGALELALACDLMVVAEQARLGDTHAKWGLRPTWGMSQRLLHAVGPVRARELSYTARNFTGAEAAQWQLATKSVPAEQLEHAVAEIAEQVETNSPGSVAAYKDLYGAALDRGLTDGLAYEAATSYEIADTQERLDTFGKR